MVNLGNSSIMIMSQLVEVYELITYIESHEHELYKITSYL